MREAPTLIYLLESRQPALLPNLIYCPTIFDIDMAHEMEMLLLQIGYF
jgi:hypothetical protein